MILLEINNTVADIDGTLLDLELIEDLDEHFEESSVVETNKSFLRKYKLHFLYSNTLYRYLGFNANVWHNIKDFVQLMGVPKHEFKVLTMLPNKEEYFKYHSYRGIDETYIELSWKQLIDSKLSWVRNYLGDIDVIFVDSVKGLKAYNTEGNILIGHYESGGWNKLKVEDFKGLRNLWNEWVRFKSIRNRYNEVKVRELENKNVTEASTVADVEIKPIDDWNAPEDVKEAIDVLSDYNDSIASKKKDKQEVLKFPKVTPK